MGEDRPALDVRVPLEAPDLNPLLDALLDDYHPFAIEDLDDATRRVHFSCDGDRSAAARAVEQRFGAAGVRTVAIDVPDEDWAERSQAALCAVRVDRVVVTPPWDSPDVSPHETVVVIRPSMGFGTGHHASTRLCLRALQARPVLGHTVLDVGTGSGVLAIAAAKLGAASVVAVDSDGDAVATAKANVCLNDLATRVEVRHGDFRHAAGLGEASIVLANLSGEVIRHHIPPLRRLVNPGGVLIVGGLLAEEEPALRLALARVGAVVAAFSEDGWVAFALEVAGPRP